MPELMKRTRGDDDANSNGIMASVNRCVETTFVRKAFSKASATVICPAATAKS